MSLKKINDFSSFVTNNQKKSLFRRSSPDSKTAKLVELILDGETKDEAQIITQLYGNQYVGRSFDMLKSRAKGKLIDALFQIDTNKAMKGSYTRGHFNACKNLYAGLIFSSLGKDETAIELLNHAKNVAAKFYLTELELIATKRLKYYASLYGQRRLFEKLSKREIELLKKSQDECLSDDLNQGLIIRVVNTTSSLEDIADMTKNYLRQAKEILISTDSFTTRINYYRIGIRYFSIIHDYKKLILLADECLAYLEQNKHMPYNTRKAEMNLQKLFGSLHLRDYENGSKYAAVCFNLFNPNTANWLIFLEYYFLLCLHTQKITEASNLLETVFDSPIFKTISPTDQEKWRIFEAFLEYLKPKHADKGKKFNVARFVNEVPIFSKDKAGYNFSIIIAQVILLIKEGKLDQVVSKAESLKIYASRYIKKDKSPRSYYFLKMLLVMIKYDFDPDKTTQISQKFFDKLISTHPGEINEVETLEVIPYDLLWPKLIEQLQLRPVSNGNKIVN